MKRILLPIYFILLYNLLYSQCINTTQFPLQPTVASAYQDTVVIATNSYAGDFATITDLTIGEDFVITSSRAGDYITIRDVYDPTVLLAHGPTPLSYTVTGPDLIAAHFNLQSPPCGTETSDRTTTIHCVTCSVPPPTVGINTSTPSATLDVNGEIRVGSSQRPSEAGMIRWNDVSEDFEGFNGEKWISLTKSNQAGQWGSPTINDMAPDEKLTASDGASNDFFGVSVSISGDYAVIGASGDDIGSVTNQGSAYIFQRTGSSWTQQAKLTASDGASSDFFGVSVSISGDYAVIGASGDQIGSNTNQGSAYIFQRTGSSWTQQAKLTASDGASSDFFGTSVSISGDYAIIGAYGDDIDSNSDQGSAYIFRREESSWTQQTKLTASDGASFDYFGRSVAVSGDQAIIGADGDDIDSNSGQGSAYVFLRAGSSWFQLAKLTASDGASGDFFGRSVSVSGDYAVVGVERDDIGSSTDQGSAYVFQREGSSWPQQAKLTASDGASFDFFGTSVSISGDYVVIGVDGNDIDSNADQGSAYVFQREGSSWTQRAKLTASDGASTDNFGRSVSLSGDHAVIGAILDDIGSNTYQGSAYTVSKK